MSASRANDHDDYDVVVVGAGFAGLYALYKLRSSGHSVRLYEAGPDVGGTWYWNRYPGARCDVESLDYSYSFSPELQQDWEWSSRYATQPEILRYLRHVAERFDLRRDIRFETRVLAAAYDPATHRWAVRTDRGDMVTTRFCVMATGCLSSAQSPDLPGSELFQGEIYHTGRWPGPVDFAGQRVGVIGTGSSGIQAIPVVAQAADQVVVFQRTANFSIPARDAPLDPRRVADVKATYPARREAARHTPGGVVGPRPTGGVFDVDDEERLAILEQAWNIGGTAMQFTFNDLLVNEASNEVVAEFMRAKIRDVVVDPGVAEVLSPRDYPMGAKRICKDTSYYETFNRSNVDLVDLRSESIEGLYERGLRTGKADYPLDSLIFATGFDAMTGALSRIEIVGREGVRLSDEWAGGPQTYLGLMVAGFPNLFIVTGPGSPSVLSNMVVSIEQHIEWIAQCIEDLAGSGHTAIEASGEAQSDWVSHVHEVASGTLYMKARSWYIGANIPGKPEVFMPYVGGVGRYRETCDEVARSGYSGFVLTNRDGIEEHRSPDHLDESPEGNEQVVGLTS